MLGDKIRDLAQKKGKAFETLQKYNFKPPVFTRQYINVRFKEIQTILGSNTGLSVKYARKTLANFLLENGVSIEVTAKVLGHANLQMVQKHYAQIREKRVLKEIKNLN